MLPNKEQAIWQIEQAYEMDPDIESNIWEIGHDKTVLVDLPEYPEAVIAIVKPELLSAKWSMYIIDNGLIRGYYFIHDYVMYIVMEKLEVGTYRLRKMLWDIRGTFQEQLAELEKVSKMWNEILWNFIDQEFGDKFDFYCLDIARPQNYGLRGNEIILLDPLID